jgi:hypothetical protein
MDSKQDGESDVIEKSTTFGQKPSVVLWLSVPRFYEKFSGERQAPPHIAAHTVALGTPIFLTPSIQQRT